MSDIREALESAMNSASEEPTPEPVAPVAELADTANVDVAPVHQDVEAATQTPVEKAAAEARARDEHGRFAPKTATPKAPKLASGQPKQTAPGETTDSAGAVPPPEAKPDAPAAVATQDALKAPQSWKATVREHWSKLPTDVQAEVARREKEISVAMQESAESRKLADNFKQTVAPFEAMIRAEGADPIKAVGSLLQTAMALRTAPPAHKAQLVANMCKSFGVPIDLLDAAISGQMPTQSQGAVDPSQLAAQIKADLMREMQQGRQQAAMQKGAQEVEAFASKAEFLDDVRHEVADLLEVSARRGQTLSLEDAYNRVVRTHPDISKVLQQREAAKQAANATASTQRARAAASSVRSQPATVQPAQSDDSIRAALEAAIAGGR